MDARVRSQAGQIPWSKARALIETGKVFVDAQCVTDPGAILPPQAVIEIRVNAPRPSTHQRLGSDTIVHCDDQVVVVNKPSGINSVPFEVGERGTLQELVRAWLNRTAQQRRDRSTGDLGIVHRIDKETSGLLVFTRTLAAKRHLAQQFRLHTVKRRYFAIAYGQVSAQVIRSNLVEDRGDGLRGSTTMAGIGQHAVTHVKPVKDLGPATLVACELETGRTHQIRIHLSELGHPLVGERVYIRQFAGDVIAAERLMLHAATLGFEHPRTGKSMSFEMPIPDDMQQLIDRLQVAR